MATVAPLYKVPGRRYFSDSKIPTLYERTKGAIRGILAEANYIALTTDCWSSANLHPYMSLTAHFINDQWQLESACLNCCSLDVDHTAANLKDALLMCCESWGIRSDSIAACTTDNGANILKAVELLPWDHLSCFGHSMNTGASNALALPMIKTSLGRVNKIRSVLHYSSKLKRELREEQVALEIRQRSIPASCPTRWWSLLEMSEVAVEQSKAINAVLMKYPKHAYLSLQMKEIKLMERIVETLSPLRDISTFLSGEAYVTASALWPLYQQVKIAAAHTRQNPPKDPFIYDPDETQFDEPGVRQQDNSFFTQQCDEADEERLTYELHVVEKNMQDAIVNALDKRYEHDRNLARISNAKSLLQLATFLDPRFKNEYFGRGELQGIKENVLSEMFLVDNDHESTNAEGDEGPSRPKVSKPNKLTLGALFKKFQANSSVVESGTPLSRSDQNKSEVEKYMVFPKADVDEDPLTWWKNHQPSLPTLATLAKKYLCIQGSSVPSERVFSCGGNVVSDHRTNLSPEHAEQLVFLSMNKKRVPKC